MKVNVFINTVLNTQMYLNTYLNTNIFKYCPALTTAIFQEEYYFFLLTLLWRIFPVCSVDNLGLNKESPSEPSLNKALGHRDAHSSRGSNGDLKVFCSINVNLSFKYQTLYMFENVERVKLKLAVDKTSCFLHFVFFC